jgi:hypothetical protein
MRLMTAVLLAAVLSSVACGGDSGGDPEAPADAGRAGDAGNPADPSDPADPGNSTDAGSVADAGGAGGPDETGSARADEYIDAITESGGGTRSDNECFARAFVDLVGVEALEAVITPDQVRQNPEVPITEIGIELSEDDANVLYDQVSLCADLTKLVAATIAAGQGLGPDAVSCISDELDDDLVRRFWVAIYAPDPAGFGLPADLQEDLTAVTALCLGAGT